MTFKDPWILLTIPLILAAIYIYSRRQRLPSFRFSSTDLVRGVSPSWKVQLSRNFIFFRLIAVALFVIALAGPRSVLEQAKHITEGIDIVLALDCSGSMAAEDFKINGERQNRLAIVKNVVADFIKRRNSDRIGMVAFSGRAYTVCPLTTDYNWLISNLERIELGMMEDGTAIGSAIISSLSRLKNSKAKNKIIILLTDGENNTGKIDPLTAAQTAKTLGVKIYTIGAGRKGFAPFPVKDLWGRTVYQNVQIDVDEKTLSEIAAITNAKYFRATDTDSLRTIYQEIDKLEKTKIEEAGYKEYKELFSAFLLMGCIVSLLEIGLANSVLMRIP